MERHTPCECQVTLLQVRTLHSRMHNSQRQVRLAQPLQNNAILNTTCCASNCRASCALVGGETGQIQLVGHVAFVPAFGARLSLLVATGLAVVLHFLAI